MMVTNAIKKECVTTKTFIWKISKAKGKKKKG